MSPITYQFKVQNTGHSLSRALSKASCSAAKSLSLFGPEVAPPQLTSKPVQWPFSLLADHHLLQPPLARPRASRRAHVQQHMASLLTRWPAENPEIAKASIGVAAYAGTLPPHTEVTTSASHKGNHWHPRPCTLVQLNGTCLADWIPSFSRLPAMSRIRHVAC